MKRISLVLLCGLLLGMQAMAQASIGAFDQSGKATQELRGEGFRIAHNSRPIGSKIKVVNTSTGKEIEATVAGRIQASNDRIIDVTPDVWRELGLNANTTVRIYTEAPTQQRPAASTPPPVVQPAPVASAPPPVSEPTQAEKPPEPEQKPAQEIAQGEPSPKTDQPPYNITVNTYVTTGEEKKPPTLPKSGSDTEFLAWLTAVIMDARDSRESREAREARESREAREARESREAREARESREARETRTYDAANVRSPPPAPVIQQVPPPPPPVAQAPPPPPPVVQAPPPPPPVAQAPPPPVYEVQVPPAPVAPPPPPPVVQAPPPPPPVVQAPPPPVEVQAPPAPVAPPPPPPIVQAPPPPVEVQAPPPPVVQAPPPPPPVVQAPPPPVVQAPPPPPPVVQAPPPPPPVYEPQPRQTPSYVQPPPPQLHVEELQVIPGLPDPNSNKIYRLQVGSFSAPDAADRTAQIIQSAGFDVAQEFNGTYYRVLVVGIPAASVYPAAQRLGAMGIGQIWVRE